MSRSAQCPMPNASLIKLPNLHFIDPSSYTHKAIGSNKLLRYVPKLNKMPGRWSLFSLNCKCSVDDGFLWHR